MSAAAKDNNLVVNSTHFDWNTIVEAKDAALPDKKPQLWLRQ